MIDIRIQVSETGGIQLRHNFTSIDGLIVFLERFKLDLLQNPPPVAQQPASGIVAATSVPVPKDLLRRAG